MTARVHLHNNILVCTARVHHSATTSVILARLIAPLIPARDKAPGAGFLAESDKSA